MAQPKNPYLNVTPGDDNWMMTGGDMRGSTVPIPVSPGTTFQSWRQQYLDPAFREQFFYSDEPGAVATRSSLPSIEDLAKAGYFNQFSLSPEEGDWLGQAIAQEQAMRDPDAGGVFGDLGLSVDDMALASVVAAPFVSAAFAPTPDASSVVGPFGGMDATSLTGADLAGAETITGAADSLASQFLAAGESGIASNPEQLLLADAGTTMTDVGAGVLGEVGGGATVDPLATGLEGAMAESAAQNAALELVSPTATGGGDGLLNSVVNWGQKNPILALGALQLGGGALKGVADAKRQEDQHAHERELVERRQQQLRELEEWRRRFGAEGAAGVKVPISSTTTPLRRPDGSPVFGSRGLLTSAVR